MNFKVSDKVVCVDDQNWSFNKLAKAKPTALPQKGRVYVIRGFAEASDGIGLLLVGIFCLPNPLWNQEWPFCPNRFRKLDEIKQLNKEAQSLCLTP